MQILLMLRALFSLVVLAVILPLLGGWILQFGGSSIGGRLTIAVPSTTVTVMHFVLFPFIF